MTYVIMPSLLMGVRVPRLESFLENLANRFPTVPRFVILDDSDVRRVVDVVRTGIADVIEPVDLVDLVDRVHAGHPISVSGVCPKMSHLYTALWTNLPTPITWRVDCVLWHRPSRPTQGSWECLLLGDGYGMNGRWVTTEPNTCTAFLNEIWRCHLESPDLGR